MADSLLSYLPPFEGLLPKWLFLVRYYLLFINNTNNTTTTSINQTPRNDS